METSATYSNSDGEIMIRFLLFPKGQEVTRSFSVHSTFGDIKQTLIDNWPTDFDRVNTVEQLKFIHSGKVIDDKQNIQGIFKLDDKEQKEAITVHIFIKQPIPVPQASTPVSQPNPTPVPISTTNESNVQNEATAEVHMHGSLFGEEEEVAYLKQIFDKKRGEDHKIPLVELYAFLTRYWQWLAETGHIDANRKFPAKRFITLKNKYVGDAERITCEQYVTIYFLIDSEASKKKCPQGGKEVVKEAAVQLHRSLNPPCHWEQNRFEDLFAYCDKDADGSLSCRELDLFLYLYQLRVTDPQLLN